MKKFSLEILCDDDFGVSITQAWSTTPQSYTVEGISSASNCVAYIDDLAFKNKNFWTPIEKFLNKFDNISDIKFNDMKKFLQRFGIVKRIDHDAGVFYFDLDNAHDLSDVHIQSDRITFSYKNSPVNNFHIIDLKDYFKVMISVFSSSYYTITESEWLDFMRAIKVDLCELRNIKLSAILDEKVVSDKSLNIIRQMNFHCKYEKRSNSFVEKINRYYYTEKKLSPSQLDMVKRILH